MRRNAESSAWKAARAHGTEFTERRKIDDQGKRVTFSERSSLLTDDDSPHERVLEDPPNRNVCDAGASVAVPDGPKNRE